MPIKVLRVVFLLLSLDFFLFFADVTGFLGCVVASESRLLHGKCGSMLTSINCKVRATHLAPAPRRCFSTGLQKAARAQGEGEKMKRCSLRSVCCYARVRIRVFVFGSRKQCTCPGGQVAVPHPNYSCEPQRTNYQPYKRKKVIRYLYWNEVIPALRNELGLSKNMLVIYVSTHGHARTRLVTSPLSLQRCKNRDIPKDKFIRCRRCTSYFEILIKVGYEILHNTLV